MLLPQKHFLFLYFFLACYDSKKRIIDFFLNMVGSILFLARTLNFNVQIWT